MADALLAGARRVLSSTLAEPAGLAEASQPTVIRFCAAIGCESIRDLRIARARSLALGTSPVRSAIADDPPEALAAKILDGTMTLLD